MICTVTDFGKNNTQFSITDCTREELENKLNLFFTSEGYKIKSEKEEGKKVYKKGNLVLRILFGAFVKYSQVMIVIEGNPSSKSAYSVLLKRDGSGISGGLIGMNQVRKEFSRLTDAFKLYFSN
jgi:hypothetical protein